MKNALVTGSAKGIGKAIVLSLAEQGYNVAVHYNLSASEAEEVAVQARAFGVNAVTLQADVTRVDAATLLVQQAHAALGGLDVLVNNVGNYHHGPLAALDADTWLAMFDSNLHATFYTSQEAVKFMRSSGGRIINIGYAGAEHLVARPGIVAYGIAKTGVILYSKALAKSEAKNNITVNVVSPGVMENSVTKPVAELPMGRTGTLAELVAAVRYLLSPEAHYVTGVHIEVSGGWNV